MPRRGRSGQNGGSIFPQATSLLPPRAQGQGGKEAAGPPWLLSPCCSSPLLALLKHLFHAWGRHVNPGPDRCQHSRPREPPTQSAALASSSPGCTSSHHPTPQRPHPGALIPWRARPAHRAQTSQSENRIRSQAPHSPPCSSRPPIRQWQPQPFRCSSQNLGIPPTPSFPHMHIQPISKHPGLYFEKNPNPTTVPPGSGHHQSPCSHSQPLVCSPQRPKGSC